ncbi:hypothetical protein CPB84DRAFT_1791286 [Gymnopilus junonius]|uniref:Uncharacterized protein n=1 Tax=Gymnopilus junonius TaxID=109634 RepID=A0A9P5THN9_GYMJU|nr:hypothetical protein CPB84DRAFT_1791286 [Gymnopilus junonius]
MEFGTPLLSILYQTSVPSTLLLVPALICRLLTYTTTFLLLPQAYLRQPSVSIYDLVSGQCLHTLPHQHKPSKIAEGSIACDVESSWFRL